MPELSVNIDHVATLRNARRTIEPDPLRAAHEAEMGGAHGVTVHLREDRRHIVDDDVRRLRESVNVRFNLEMAATDEMVDLALEIKPHTVMLVPEGRQEVTTEGGLDVAAQRDRLSKVVEKLRGGDFFISAFIDAVHDQAAAAADLGFDICEIHTGPYAAIFRALGGDLRQGRLAAELEAIASVGGRILDRGMRFNAGHALNYHNIQPIARLQGVEELHIGHAIIARSVYVGLRQAVRDMTELLRL
jgi:pyridoxine 5-phosphate synthase